MNTFQLIMSTDGELSFVTFLYADIQWTNGVQGAGIEALDFSSNNLFIPGSSYLNARNLPTTSNVGVPGMWMYRVDSNVSMPPELP